MTGLKDIQLIGDEVAIRWNDGTETYCKMDRLRALSPSAETTGERDLLGKAISGNEHGRDFSGVTVTGWVPEVLPYLGGADVVVAPMRTGGGTQLKVLEAMATGRPLVTTTFGAEGVGLTPGRHALVEDEPEGMARAIATLLTDANAGRALGAAGRELVVERFDWSVVAQRLEEVYAAL